MSVKAVKSYVKNANPFRTTREPLASAVRAVVEHLEGRQLLSADPFANENDVQAVPFVLEFDGSSTGGLHDKDGEHIGFTRVQVNKNGRDASYVQSNLDQVGGLLKITTTGNASAGSNFNNDNTLTNGVETTFNGSTSGFQITTRLVGPLSYIAEPSEQAGISFGPGQDRYIKLVAVSRPEGTRLQFTDEELSGTTYNHVLDTTRDIGSFASINTLDLRIVGDAATGKVTAFYAVNGGAFQKFTQELTLTGQRRADYFSTTAKAGLIAAHKNNNGAITASFDRFEIQPGTPISGRPTVSSVDPLNAATNVKRDAFVGAQVALTGGGIDANTLNSTTVHLFRTSDHSLVQADVGTSGGGDIITLKPSALLEKNTNYTFEVTNGLLDVAGNAFVPFTSTFTTGATGGEVDGSFSFEKVSLSNAKGEEFTSLVVGPDHRLYAGTSDGRIFRYTINNDGTLGSSQTLNVIQTANGGNKRLLTGMVFDPSSTAANPILWVTHGQYRFGLDPNGSDDTQKYADEWTGKISKITNLGGNNTGTLTDIVIGLPRSVRDHTTNQPSFGPVDHALYIPQGSNSAGGAPDAAWGNRPERQLNAAILRLDPSAFNPATPLNVKTTDGGGTYNPTAAGAKLTLYATGVRNAYDIVWTSDGFLYAPTNGTAAGANTPAGGGAPALTNVGVQHDFLFNIVPGGYYGHPNPVRQEYILGGGYTPNDGVVGPNEVPEYGSTIQPDSDYKGYAYDFGLNVSPDGVLEYQNASAFGGTLKGKLIVARFSGPNDLIVLTKNASGAITQAQTNVAGMTGFVDPLDVTEDPSTGFLYVSEYSEQDATKRRITLLRPVSGGPTATPDKPRLVFTDIQTASTGGSAASAAQTVTIKNTGTQALTISAASIVDDPAFSGDDSSQFLKVNFPTIPATLQVGETISFQVQFKAASTGLKAALLRLTTNGTTQIIDINLRGIGTASDSAGDVSGTLEPSLQRILNAYDIGVIAGDADGEGTSDFQTPRPAGTANDEVSMPHLVKAGAGPVTIETLASYQFNNKTGPVTRFGYYTPGTKDAKTELFTIDLAQRASTTPGGGASFDPGNAAFSLYDTFNGSIFEDANLIPRTSYSEDVFNTWASNVKQKFRFFPLMNKNRVIEPNAYVFTTEDFDGTQPSAFDNNDLVGIIRNVKPANTGAAPEIGTQNIDRQPSTEAGGTAAWNLNPTLLSFNRIQVQPPDPINGVQPPNNVVHDTAKLRIRNSGDASLTINSLVLGGTNASSFQLVSPPANGTVIAAGGFVDVTVKFIATSGRIKTGTLTINSNDPDEPNTVVSLVGYWQNHNENNEEPTLDEFMQLYGFSTQVAYPGELFNDPNNLGGVRRTGDEVLSPFWRRADAAESVEVVQLAAFHSQGNTATVKWHYQTSFTTTNIVTQDLNDGQSIFPRVAGGSQLAAKRFKPTTQGSDTNPAFGFRIDNEWSDDTRNPQEGGVSGHGHHVKFWVAKDLNGNVIPNTYIMGMDYSAINYDYQDNLYLIRNIKPVGGPSAPANVIPTPSGGGIALDWNDNPEPNLAGYNVYRGTTANFTPSSANKLNTNGLITQSDFNDIFAPIGTTSFYAVSAVDTTGNESGFSRTSATRATDATPPAMPAGLIVTGSVNDITLDWSDNVESDFAGYDVLRATSANGTYTKLNTNGLLTASNYVDSTAVTGTTYFYQVIAKDTAGNSSAPATGQGTRGQQTGPAGPTGLDANGTGTTTASLVWNASAGATSYRVERQGPSDSGFIEIATGVIGTSFNDSNLTPGATYAYRVRAENGTGQLSGYSNVDNATTTGVGSGILTGTAIGTVGSHVTITDGVDYDVTSSGAGITGNSDQFYFLSHAVTGDFDVKVRVDGIVNSNTLSRAGIMARASLSATSNHAFVSASSADGFRSARRTTDGGATTTTKNGTPVFPNAWVRLQRVGDTFTAYYGSNGTSWTQIFSQVMPLPQTVQLGLASSAYGSSSTNATFRLREFGDTTPAPAPGIPGNLNAVSNSPSTVDLTWDASTNAASYRVERKGPGDADFVEIASNITGTSFQDTGRAANSSYDYRVRAVSASGTVFSGYSNVATAVTQQVPAPGVPGNLNAVSNSPSTVDLSWDAGANAASYRVERKGPGDLDFVEIAANVVGTTFQDTGRAANTSYAYRVRSVSASGTVFSAYSNTATAVTQNVAAPVIPANLDAVAFNHTQINLTWGASSGATSYRIERRILGAPTFDEIAFGVTGTSYQDKGLTPQTTYEYRVRAENAGGMSDYSNTDSATTPSAPVQSPYNSSDIATGVAGSTTAQPDGTSFDIVAGGANIQSTSDSFRFVYRQITGDFDIKGQLSNLSGTNGSPKAGFMARTDLTANSANVFSHIASNGYRISRRATAGANTDIISNGGLNSYPNTWLRLQRVGNTFTAFRSTDGNNWVVIGTYTQTLPTTLLVGMAVTAQSSTQTTTAAFRNVGDFVTTPPSAPAAPTIQGSAPSSTQVSLTWQAVSGATNYRVERKGPGDADFVEIAGNVSGTSFTDNGRTAQTSYDYRVRAENSVGPSPYSNVATVVTPQAPAPSSYTAADIATPVAGSTSALPDGTSFDTVAGGTNIQANADSFHFVYRSITGDFDVKAQISSLTGTNGSPKAGLMARTDLTAGSANVFAHIASNGYRISRRATANATTDIISNGGLNSYPNTWVRLKRVGNTFTALRSTDGVNWITIGSYTAALPSTLLVGMATTAQSSTQTTSVTYRNVGDVTP